jgi:hypothetical protein
MDNAILVPPVKWFERQFSFGQPAAMLPIYLERLEGTIYRIEARVKGVSEETLSQQPGGKWSIKQHIGHLGEMDALSYKRIDEMIRGVSAITPGAFDGGSYHTQPLIEVLHFFRNSRLKNMARYRSLSEQELANGSLHPRLHVKMTPVDMAMFDADHDDHHLVIIHEILKKG